MSAYLSATKKMDEDGGYKMRRTFVNMCVWTWSQAISHRRENQQSRVSPPVHHIRSRAEVKETAVVYWHFRSINKIEKDEDDGAEPPAL